MPSKGIPTGRFFIYDSFVAVMSPLSTISLYLESVDEIIDLKLARLSAEAVFRLPLVMPLGLIGVALVALIWVGVQTATARGATCCRQGGWC